MAERIKTRPVPVTEVISNLSSRLDPVSPEMVCGRRIFQNGLFFARFTHDHKRAIIRVEDLGSDKIWTDEYGVLFGERDWKGTGAVFGKMKIRESRTATKGYTIYGLMDMFVLQDILDSSAYLRTHGLPTELIAKAYRLDKVPFAGKNRTIPELKRLLLLRYKLEHPRFMFNEQVNKFMDDVDLLLYERHVPCVARINDLLIPEERDFALARTFKWLNLMHDYGVNNGQWDYKVDRHLDPYSKRDIYYYCVEWLPKQTGRYLGILHNLGSSHGYATAHNWASVGLLYDLDSMKLPKGLAKQGGEATEIEMVRDLKATSNVITYLYCEFIKDADPTVYIGVLMKLAVDYITARLKFFSDRSDNLVSSFLDFVAQDDSNKNLHNQWSVHQEELSRYLRETGL